MRAYKTVNDSYIEPISFTVPRRAETFQADIFPPAVGTKPAASAKEWFNGKTDLPAKIDLESIYEGTAPKEVPSDYKQPAQPTPAPVAAAAAAPVKEEPKKEEPKPTPVIRGPPPSMNDQKTSMSNMANKFQDNEEDEEEDDDETSSFEEISRPPQRAAGVSRIDPKPLPVPIKTQPAPAPVPVQEAVKPASPAKTPTPTTSSAAPRSSTPSVGVEASLDQIKQLLENQTKIITAQNDKISQLVGEVEALKKKVNASGSQDQSERIRQLELELEEARS
jgi:coronin-1B/1C/6